MSYERRRLLEQCAFRWCLIDLRQSESGWGQRVHAEKGVCFSCVWCHNIPVQEMTVRQAHPSQSWNGTTKLACSPQQTGGIACTCMYDIMAWNMPPPPYAHGRGQSVCKLYMALRQVKSCPWAERPHWPTLSIGSSQLLEKEEREKEEFPLSGVDLLVLGSHQ